MPSLYGKFLRIFPLAAFSIAAIASHAAQGGNAGSVRGTVTDPSGAVIPGATVHLTNAISGLDRSVTTDATGQFEIDNVPFNNYKLSVSASGFASQSQNFTLRSAVGMSLKLVLQIAAADFNRNGRSLGRSGRDRPHVSHRRGSRHVHQGAAGEPILFAQFSGHAHHARRVGRFQRPVSWSGRPRIQLVLGGWPVHHRPAEQGLFEPASLQLDPVHPGHLRRAAGRVRRQDQPGDRGHYPFRPGSDQADRQREQPRTEVSAPRRQDSTSPMAERTGATSLRWMV